MSTVLIVPGWRDSGPGHWQTLWAEQLPGAVRVHQDDWITPTRSAWVASITRHILEIDGPVVIAAHSLGCIATSHLPPEATERIVGALLVAPADPERRGILADFAPVPYPPKRKPCWMQGVICGRLSLHTPTCAPCAMNSS